MFHYVTDRINSDKPAILNHRKVAEPLLGHPSHDFVNRITHSASLYLARHHLAHWLITDLASARISSFASECPKNVPFSENAHHLLVGVGDYHGTDLALVKDRDGITKARRRRDRDDRITFVGQDSFDCH
jgi:hypothetical protein